MTRMCNIWPNVTCHTQSGGDAPLLFTENETNTQRLFGVDNYTPYVKDAFHRYLVEGKAAWYGDEEGIQAVDHGGN